MRSSCAAALCWIALTATSPVALAAADVRLDVIGEATDPATGDLLYREYHQCTPDALHCVVEYRDGQSLVIARKELDYRSSAIAPAVAMRDLRTGRESIQAGGADDGVVVDAGFDNFVRLQWEALEQGREVSFPFRPAGFDRPITMSAVAIGDGPCSEQQLCLRVSVQSWLLGLLARPIELAYSRDERRLLLFRGVSNIRSAGGDTQYVEIRYDHLARMQG